MACKTEIIGVNANWVGVKNACRHTVNKDSTPGEPGRDFKIRLLISEHSPIRKIRINWFWSAIKSWVSVHFARHWLGWEKWVGTRRTDRTGINREELRQDELVPMEVEADAQALINVSRFRLCYQAAKDTREQMEELKHSIGEVEEEIAFVMVPNCIYRGGCPEMQGCTFFQSFIKRHQDIDFFNIRERYEAYNRDFKVNYER